MARAAARAASMSRQSPLRGVARGHRPLGGQQIRHDLMRADDLDAVGFDHAGKRAQQTVVALGQRGQRARQQRNEREARLHALQLRAAADAAGKHGVGHAVPLEQRGKGGEILERARSSCSKAARLGAASPCIITTKGGCPCAARLSARSTGSLPLPATTATLSPAATGCGCAPQSSSSTLPLSAALAKRRNENAACRGRGRKSMTSRTAAESGELARRRVRDFRRPAGRGRRSSGRPCGARRSPREACRSASFRQCSSRAGRPDFPTPCRRG